VCSDPPAFLLESTFASGDLELVLWVTDGGGVLGIEHREVTADYFVGVVTLDALRTLVPAGDVASRVEHDDGVVPHGVDHQLVDATAVPYRLGESRVGDRRDWGWAAVRQVARPGAPGR